MESNIAYVLLDKANKGDLQAIKLLIDVFGWNASTKIEQTINDKRQGFIEYEIE